MTGGTQASKSCDQRIDVLTGSCGPGGVVLIPPGVTWGLLVVPIVLGAAASLSSVAASSSGDGLESQSLTKMPSLKYDSGFC